MLGVDVNGHLDRIAAAFSAGSPRIHQAANPPPPLPTLEEFQPLSSFLTGPALLSKATQIVHAARQAYDEADETEPPQIAPIPLFSALATDGLRALIEAFEMITVPADAHVVREGAEGAEAYIVARGELEVRREPTDGAGGEPLVLARLTNGALFGEMALLSRAPRAASVVACRPSILLVAKRETLEAVAERRPEVGVELAAHCRRRMVANLMRTSPVLHAVAPEERPSLVERFETRVYEKGEKLIAEGDDAAGLHLVASGEVAVIGHEGGEPIVLATLGPGQTAGEVALVLRRKAVADVVAVHPAVTLFLRREEFLTLVRDHPAILHPLYVLAVQRDDETALVLAGDVTMSAADDYVLL
jgi:cAMP-dependent protein kinase regulator